DTRDVGPGRGDRLCRAVGALRRREDREAHWKHRDADGAGRRPELRPFVHRIAPARPSAGGVPADPAPHRGHRGRSGDRGPGSEEIRNEPKDTRPFMTKIQSPRGMTLGIEEKYEEVRQLIS